MNNSNGFKMTEIGQLPEDWEVRRLGDMANQRKESITPVGDGKTKYVGLEHIDSGHSRLQRYGFDNEVKSTKFKFFKDDILYGKLRPYLDKCILSDLEGVCSTDIIVIKTSNQIDCKYLVNIMHIKSFANYATSTMTGVNHPRTSWKALSAYKIPLPQLPEQQKIASALSIIQEAKEKTENIIKATKELKKSMMKHLFTYGPVPVKSPLSRGDLGVCHEEGKVTHPLPLLLEGRQPKLKETEIGMIPEHWGMVRLGEIAEFKNGINFSSNQKGVEGILTLDVLNMYTENIYAKLNNLYRVRIDLKNKSDYLLKEGDVLFVRSSLKREGVGWASLFKSYKEPVTFCGFIIRCRLKDASKIEHRFLISFLRSEAARKELLAGSEQVAITNINQGLLNRLTLPFPPYNEQVQIAETLRAIDKKIESEQNKKQALDALFKTLLSLLMTGKIRVKDLEV